VRIVLFIVELTVGGTQRQVAVLASAMAQRGCDVCVVALFPGGKFWTMLRDDPAVSTCSLFSKKRKGLWSALRSRCLGIMRLRRKLRAMDSPVIYSFLNDGNVLAWFATRGTASSRLAWAVRSGNSSLSAKSEVFFRISRILSPGMPLVISNSSAGRSHCEDKGWRPKCFSVVPNGIDTDRFVPDADQRRRVRRDLGIDDDTLLVGLVGRVSPVKNHENFLRAAVCVLQVKKSVRFVCVGGGPAKLMSRLVALQNELGLRDSLAWHEDQDTRKYYCAFDITCMVSTGEGFPNVVAESMSCATPCIVTDVGDAAEIVADTGVIAMGTEPAQIAAAILELAELSEADRQAMGEKARLSIRARYSIDRLVTATAAELTRLSCDQ